MRRRVKSVVVVFIVAVSAFARAKGQDTPQRKAPELQVLERFVGSWEEKVEVKPAAWTPERATITATGTRKWIMNGHMIENRGVWSPSKDEFLHLTGYDPEQREYRQWYFDKNTPVPQEYRGTWDEASRTFSFKGMLQGGATGICTQKFIDQDTFTWTLVAKDRSGTVVLDMQGKCVRMK